MEFDIDYEGLIEDIKSNTKSHFDLINKNNYLNSNIKHYIIIDNIDNYDLEDSNNTIEISKNEILDVMLYMFNKMDFRYLNMIKVDVDIINMLDDKLKYQSILKKELFINLFKEKPIEMVEIFKGLNKDYDEFTRHI